MRTYKMVEQKVTLDIKQSKFLVFYKWEIWGPGNENDWSKWSLLFLLWLWKAPSTVSLCTGLQKHMLTTPLTSYKGNTIPINDNWCDGWCLASMLKGPWESQDLVNRLLHFDSAAHRQASTLLLASQAQYIQSPQGLMAWQSPLFKRLRTVLSQSGFCRMFTGITWKKGLGQVCLEYIINYNRTMKGNL